MLEVRAKLKSLSPLVYGKVITEEKPKGESYISFEERTYLQKCHKTKDGELFIPANALKNCLINTSKYLKETPPDGDGKETYTKFYQMGVMVQSDIMLGQSTDAIQQLLLHVPSNGRTGGTTRVWKIFPILPNWEAEVRILIFDKTLIANINKVEEYLTVGGQFIGLLTFRPKNNGDYGRYDVVDFKTTKFKG